MSVETELLFLLVRPRLSVPAAQRLAALLQGDVNWAHLIGGALSHDVLPLAARRLFDAPAGTVPEAIGDGLRQYVDRHTEQARYLAGELVGLSALLESHAIPAVTFKGPALAAALYGDVSFRACADLDFLISRRDAVRARDLVLQAGYRLRTALGADGLPAWEGIYEYTFDSEDGRVIAELHWRLTPLHLRNSLDLEHLDDPRRVAVNGHRVATLSTEDSLLMLCIHGDKHHWALLKWILDVAQLLAQAADLDWKRVELKAHRLGCWRMVRLGLLLAAEVLDAPLPVHVLKRRRGDAGLSRLVAGVQHELARAEDPSVYVPAETVRPYHPFELIEHVADRSRLVARFIDETVRRALTITERDRALLRLPRLLFFAYYPLRAARLFRLYVGSAVINRVRSLGLNRTNETTTPRESRATPERRTARTAPP